MSGNPPIHIKTDDGDLRICFSRAMKIAVGAATTLIAILLSGAFAFAWSSNDKLGDINERLNSIDQRFEANSNRMDRIELRLDRKLDK